MRPCPGARLDALIGIYGMELNSIKTSKTYLHVLRWIWINLRFKPKKFWNPRPTKTQLSTLQLYSRPRTTNSPTNSIWSQHSLQTTNTMASLMIKRIALLAFGLSLALATPMPSTEGGKTLQERITSNAPNYYSGPWNNFPDISTWLSFNDMFDKNRPFMLMAGSTSDDIDKIFTAIQ